MNKILTLAVFGVAAVAVAMAVTLAAPPAKAWDATDECLLWYTTQNQPEVAITLGEPIVWAADGADLGCNNAIQECWSQGLYLLYTDQSFIDNC